MPISEVNDKKIGYLVDIFYESLTGSRFLPFFKNFLCFFPRLILHPASCTLI